MNQLISVVRVPITIPDGPRSGIVPIPAAILDIRITVIAGSSASVLDSTSSYREESSFAALIIWLKICIIAGSRLLKMLRGRLELTGLLRPGMCL